MAAVSWAHGPSLKASVDSRVRSAVIRLDTLAAACGLDDPFGPAQIGIRVLQQLSRAAHECRACSLLHSEGICASPRWNRLATSIRPALPAESGLRRSAAGRDLVAAADALM